MKLTVPAPLQAHPDNHDALQALTDVLFKAACCEEDLVTVREKCSSSFTDISKLRVPEG